MLQAPLQISILMTVDRNGAISDVRTLADPAGEPATKCVEQAILTAVEFAPMERSTGVPIHVRLEPWPEPGR